MSTAREIAAWPARNYRIDKTDEGKFLWVVIYIPREESIAEFTSKMDAEAFRDLKEEFMLKSGNLP